MDKNTSMLEAHETICLFLDNKLNQIKESAMPDKYKEDALDFGEGLRETLNIVSKHVQLLDLYSLILGLTTVFITTPSDYFKLLDVFNRGIRNYAKCALKESSGKFKEEK